MYKSKIPFCITQNKLIVFFKMCFYKFYKNKDLNNKETKIKKIFTNESIHFCNKFII